MGYFFVFMKLFLNHSYLLTALCLIEEVIKNVGGDLYEKRYYLFHAAIDGDAKLW
jgi:hypothetical protein